jgi:hypothetical protein
MRGGQSASEQARDAAFGITVDGTMALTGHHQLTQLHGIAYELRKVMVNSSLLRYTVNPMLCKKKKKKKTPENAKGGKVHMFCSIQARHVPSCL